MKFTLLRWYYKWCLTRNRWHAIELDDQYRYERTRLLKSDRELYERLQQLGVDEAQASIQEALR